MSTLTEHLKWSGFAAFAIVCVIGAVAGDAPGQDLGGRRVYDEQLRVELDQQASDIKDIGFDAGGWFNFALFQYDDSAANRDRTLRQFELRGWASLNIRQEHSFYVRALIGWDDWNSGDNPAGRGDEDTDLEIERAWYVFDLGQMLYNRTGKEPPVGFRVKTGRAFASIGTALVLSMPMDMIQFNVETGNFDLMAFMGNPRTNSNNIDDSLPVATHQKRCIWGVELGYTFDEHRPFVYYMHNDDHTNPRPASSSQSYEYSSRYLGVGSRGSLISPNLRYETEFVFEWGKTYSENVTTGSKDNIRAHAFNLLLEYFFPTRMHPKVSAEYLYASGDSDRRLSATSTIGGNTAGTNDRAFNAFGFRDTGLAFAPRISNLHMYSAGVSLFPLEHTKCFKKMEVGTKLFFYHRASASGPISDTTTTGTAQWLGWEWDVFCDWRITSDLTWTVRYGNFQPGAAFSGSNDETRQFFYTGMTFSF